MSRLLPANLLSLIGSSHVRSLVVGVVWRLEVLNMKSLNVTVFCKFMPQVPASTTGIYIGL